MQMMKLGMDAEVRDAGSNVGLHLQTCYPDR